MKIFFKFVRIAVGLGFIGMSVGALALIAAYLYLAPGLPSIDSLRDVKLQVPLRIFTRDGTLMAEFGEKRRTPVKFNHAPDKMIKAFLAAEDDRFFSHPGVDYQGLIRAAVQVVRTGEKVQGGSTITMQVARNFFLSSEKTYLRKLNEIFLSLKIERSLTKEDILELYLNKIYLGNRSYGVQAAAQVYYGKNVHELTLAQTAMIAGLPKAPSSYNPIANPPRALTRRNYILDRMLALEYITPEEHAAAKNEPSTAKLHGLDIQVEAPYVAEMVRAEMVKRFGSEAYSEGYRVYTTIDSNYQSYATAALRKALLDYDVRHGYRGPEKHLATVFLRSRDNPDLVKEWDEMIADLSKVGGLLPGLVTQVDDQQALVYLGSGKDVKLDLASVEWARPHIDNNRLGPKPTKVSEVLRLGDIVRVQQVELTEEAKAALAEAKAAQAATHEAVIEDPIEPEQWRLSQIPAVSGAIVSLFPKDGSIAALAGGFDFYHSKFNRAIQAKRQPGSSFKPFIYSAALESGFTPASLINDAPVVFEDPGLENTWRPENYSGKFYGPTRLREALVRSRNLVSIRLLRAIGMPFAIKYISQFGLPESSMPRNLSLALGSGSLTPLDLATAYCVFANGGFRVENHFIARIENDEGAVIYEANPLVACPECSTKETEKSLKISLNGAHRETSDPPVDDKTAAFTEDADANPVVSNDPNAVFSTSRTAPRVISEQNAYLMNSMMRDVIKRGTGKRAMSLGRNDLAGKTGTTNDQHDAWFAGFNAEVVTAAWVGFDSIQPLGQRETGGVAALPMWIDFMGSALKGMPESNLPQPPGLVTVRIDPDTGLLASSNNPNAVFETFRSEHVPKNEATTAQETYNTGSGESSRPESIF